MDPTTPPATPVPPPEPPANVPSGSGDTPLLPTRKPRRALKITVLLIVIAAIAGAAYLLFASPKLALPDYLGRLVKARTTTLATSLSSSGADYKVNLKISGKDDLTDAAKPKVDLSITGELSSGKGATPLGGAASGSLSGRLRTTGQTLYFKIESFTYLTQLIPIKLSNDWYKYDLSTSETNKCLTKGKGSGSFLGSSILTQIPVKNARFAGVETVNGALSLHYLGAVDNAKVQAAVDQANKSLSADCKLDITASDYKDIAVTYELWRGWSKDRLKLTITDTKAKTSGEIILDTGAYNKPVKIDAPAGAKDIAELLGNLTFPTEPDSGNGAASTRTHVPTANASDVQKARDTTRKTDIVTLRKALEEYFVNNNYYPKTLAELTVGSPGAPAVIQKIPVDPTNKAPYSYSYTPDTPDGGYFTKYTLRACLENAADVSSNVIDPVAPCKTATYEVFNGN